jgi:hypothetical protein
MKEGREGRREGGREGGRKEDLLFQSLLWTLAEPRKESAKIV